MRNTNVDEGEEYPIYGDLLEVILSKVPLVDLVSASSVSKSWDYAVSSSLSHLKKLKPWVVIHTQSTISLAKRTTHAYDPRSNTWIEISRPLNPKETPTLLSSSSSNLVYELSDKGLAFSSDPLHQTWAHIPRPKVWRVDPLVTLVGRNVIVAGGAMYFENDLLSVEMYDMETSRWSTCQSMPRILKDSTTSTWISTTTNQHKLYITQKSSGITYTFDPKTKTWCGPYDLNPDPRVFFSAIDFAGDDLILVGLIGHAENVKTIKLWKIKPELNKFSEIAEIPNKLLEELKGENWNFSSIILLANNDFICMYKNSDPSIIIFCENIDGKWKWASVKNIVYDDIRIKDKIVISCTKVGILDLRLAMNSKNCKFIVKSPN
ncbi:hypothetical protein RND81_02G238800 [Saponaria officinalis]|uniref:F-box domain-containing protein n=1 Tax=Saponaria officinalis TaxID=3572 RepID=A0AAW1MX25_SAPOF